MSAHHGLASTIGAGILTHYASLAISLGVDVNAMLLQSGVDKRCLVDPSLPVSVERAARLIRLTAEAAASNTFGIELTLGRGTPDLGPLNLLLREEPDLESALRSLERYFHIHSTGMTIKIETDDANAYILIMLEPAAMAEQPMEMVVCGLLQSVRWLVGGALRPVLICFQHVGPADRRRHSRLLESPVAFEQPFDGIVLDRHDLSRPLANADPNLRRHAESYVRALAAEQSLSFVEQVERMVIAQLPSGQCSADRVARQLGIGRATLARRLAANGTSFSAVLDALRGEIAEKASASDLPLTKIAERLGYADLSSFSRWFSRRYGCSPRTWRMRRS